MNVSYHFKQRLAERCHGVKLKGRELDAHVRLRSDELEMEALDLYRKSVFLWQGQLYEKLPVANYYYCNGWILVSDSNKANLITLYPIELPFPENVTQKIILEVLKTIDKLREKRRKLAEKKVPWFKKQRAKKVQLETEIAKLNEELQKVTKELGEADRELDTYADDIEKNAIIICNSLKVKTDLMEGWKLK